MPRGFRVRALFLNDEDLLAGFGADPLGDGISADLYNKVFEAVLRMKGNAVIPGTAPFPDQRGAFTLAAKRGIAIMQHHVTPVGLNVMRWPNPPRSGASSATGFSSGGAPYSFLSAGRIPPILATDDLLENTDGVRVGGATLSVFSRGGSLLPFYLC